MSEQAKAKERQSLSQVQNRLRNELGHPVSPPGDAPAIDSNAGRTTARIAEQAGVGRTTV